MSGYLFNSSLSGRRFGDGETWKSMLISEKNIYSTSHSLVGQWDGGGSSPLLSPLQVDVLTK